MAQSSAAGLPASAPEGCLSLHTCRFTKKRGQIHPLPHPSPVLPPCLEAGLVAGALLPLDAGAVASPGRTASEDSKGIPEGNISAVTAQAGLPSGSGAVPRHSSCVLGTWAVLGLSTGLVVPTAKGMVGWKQHLTQDGHMGWHFRMQRQKQEGPAWLQCTPCEPPST